MSTKRTLFWISIIGALIPLFIWVHSKTGSGVFVILVIFSSFCGIGLLLYAAVREKAHGDTSETISPKSTAVMLGVIGLYVAFVLYHALLR